MTVSESMDTDHADRHSYAVVLAYDGRPFFGWQRLRDKPTVQGAVETAIEQAFGERVAVRGAGRTDRGAHAEGQVAGFELARAVEPVELARRLDDALPESIRTRGVHSVAQGFHVRDSAVGKLYEYRIVNRHALPPALDRRVWHVPAALDVAAMARASRALVGVHDFASFATRPRFKQKSTVRDMRAIDIERDGDDIVLRFHANSFLMHMVRNLVRALVKVGQRRYAPEQIPTILAARDRAASPGTAPASGLYLIRVLYADGPLG